MFSQSKSTFGILLLGCQYFSDVTSCVLVCKYVEIISKLHYVNSSICSRSMLDLFVLCSILLIEEDFANLASMQCLRLWMRTCFCSIVPPHHHLRSAFSCTMLFTFSMKCAREVPKMPCSIKFVISQSTCHQQSKHCSDCFRQWHRTE